VAYGLRGLPVPGLPLLDGDAEVIAVALEVDWPVDDILVELSAGRLFLQAKHALSFGRPFEEVLSQWLGAVRDPEFDPEHDYIGVVSDSVSSSVKALGFALDRLRAGSASLSESERRGVEKVRVLLRAKDASPTEIKTVLNRALVIRLALDRPEQTDADRGRLLLDGRVAREGEGARAWRELVELCGEAARMRLGRPIPAWLDALRRRGVALVADEESSRAARIESRRRALERYKEKLQEEGDYVDLTSVGARLARIPFAEIDGGVGVRDPEDQRADGRDLLWAFRRIGRVVLTGLPGGGKSTAVAAAAAAWSRRESWAIPILLPLRRVARRDRAARPLRDEILDLAAERVDPFDRPIVRDALDVALGEGNVVLFLDGLDEAYARSLPLAGEIASLLRGLHKDTDVLLATRDVAYADAQILEFPDLRLTAPTNIKGMVAAVLKAAAANKELGVSEEAWVAERREWVDGVLEQDAQLRETPLLPVLLALLASDRERDELPRTRAVILARVIEDVVRRTGQQRWHVSGIPEGHEDEALLSAFPTIAAVIAENSGSAPLDQIAGVLALDLGTQWGLAPAAASAAARDILTFWDEAGVFVASGATPVVTARLRLFLEIGAAMESARLEGGHATAWVERIATQTELRESLVLAAGLSRTIAEALIARSLRTDSELDDDLALAAADALTQGGSASDDSLRRLIDRLLLLLRPGDQAAWRAYQTLARLPVPPDMHERVLQEVKRDFPEPYVDVAMAYASLEWDWSPDRREALLTTALQIPALPRLGGRRLRSGRDRFSWVGVDRALMRVKEGAASVLLPGRPEFSEIVARAITQQVSIGTAERLAEILRANGHGALANETLVEAMRVGEGVMALARSFGSVRDQMREMIESTKSLAEPAPISVGQRRRLSELASFMEALNLNSASAWLQGEELRKVRSDWFRLVSALGGFDPSVLSAEAEILEREVNLEGEPEYDAFLSLLGREQAPNLQHWDRVSHRDDARALAVRMLRGPLDVAVIAAEALAHCPDRERAVDDIRAALPAIPRKSQRAAVWVYLQLVPDRFCRRARPRPRTVVGHPGGRGCRRSPCIRRQSIEPRPDASSGSRTNGAARGVAKSRRPPGGPGLP
jgi:hypothetical protein